MRIIIDTAKVQIFQQSIVASGPGDLLRGLEKSIELLVMMLNTFAKPHHVSPSLEASPIKTIESPDVVAVSTIRACT